MIAGPAFAGLLIATLMLLPGGEPAPRPAVTTAGPASAVATTADAAPSRSAVAPSLAAGVYGALPGACFRYQLTDASEYTILSRDAGQQQGAGLHTQATLLLQVLARSSDEVLLRAHFTDITFAGADGRAITDDALQLSFTAAAQGEVLLRLGGDGSVHGYRFQDGLDGDQRNFLRGTLAAFAFTVPVATPAEWDADEADATGAYCAHYRQLPATAADRTNVQRRKLRYSAMAGQEPVPQHELRGAATAHFGTDLGWLRAASIDEGMITSLPLLDLRVDYHRRAELVLVASGNDPLPAGVEALWSGDWAPASGQGETLGNHAEAAEHRRWQQQLAGVDLAQLISELQGVFARQPVDHAALDAAFQKLQWLVQLEPQNAAAIAQLVSERSLGADVAAVMLSALAAAGTDVAQSALMTVRADATLPAELRDAATVALLQLARPLPQLVDGLAADAASSADGNLGAMLVLGALAPRCAEPLASGRSAMAALLQLEGEAESRAELPTWLRALGNAGTPEAFAAASRHLDSQDAEVRGAACAALRRVATAAAVDCLCQRGLSDAEPAVRCEAAVALGQRSEPAAAAALRTAAIDDREPAVRRASLLALGRSLAVTANRLVLEQAAANDADSSLRQLAASMLRGA